MSKTLSAILVLLFAAAASGQVKGPTEISVKVGRLASIPLTIDADETTYSVLGADYFDSFREFSSPTELKLRVLGYANGTGYIVVASQKDGKLSPLFIVKVIVGDAPAPPDPPGPNPPQPGPLDPLAASIKSAATADGFTKLKQLSEGLTAADAISKSRASWTVAELSSAWQTAMRSAVGGPTSASVAKILSAELNAALPREAVHVMTADEMAKARTLILKLAKACEEASK